MKITNLSSAASHKSSLIHSSPGHLDGEKRFRLLIESVTDYGFVLLDINGNVESRNLNAVKMQGYTNEEVLGRPLSLFYVQADIDKEVPQKHLDLARKYGRVEEDINMVRKDGSYFWSTVVITAMKDEADLPIGFSLMIRDLTKFKEVEEKLRQGEAMARKIFDGIKDYAVYTLDLEGKIRSWNEGARRIKGYEAEEVIGKHFSIFLPGESSPDKSKYEIDETVSTGRYVEEGWRIRKDGSRFWANVVISAIRNDEGEIIGFTKVTRDLTDRKRSEDLLKMAYTDLERKIDQRTNELMTTNIKLQEAIKTRDEFLSIASHELKTPLTPLKLQTQIIRRKVNDGSFKKLDEDKIYKIMNVLETSVNRLTDLIENLLDVSRINLERMVIRKERINLKNVFEDVFDRYQSTIVLAKTEVTLNISGDIIGDFDQLRIEQVFLNFLMNALKYGEQKPITINVYEEENCACVEFQDQGTGISKEYHSRIFERYEQLDVHKNVSGLGLGLYITKEIVESHGGTITVDSEESKGSVFKVIIPL